MKKRNLLTITFFAGGLCLLLTDIIEQVLGENIFSWVFGLGVFLTVLYGLNNIKVTN